MVLGSCRSAQKAWAGRWIPGGVQVCVSGEVKCRYCGQDAAHSFTELGSFEYMRGDEAGCVFRSGSVTRRVLSSSLDSRHVREWDESAGLSGLRILKRNPMIIEWTCSGLPLSIRISSGNIAPELVWSWFRTSVGALAVLHSRGMAHGFISASTILVAQDNALCMVDYGLVEGTPWHDMVTLGELFAGLLSDMPPYPGLDDFRRIVFDMVEGKFSSAIEFKDSTHLPRLLRELSYGQENNIRRWWHWYQAHRPAVWFFMILVSFSLAWFLGDRASGEMDGFYLPEFPSAPAVSGMRFNTQERVGGTDLSFAFNRLPAGGDLYFYIPETMVGMSRMLVYLGLPPRVIRVGAAAYKMPSWGRTVPLGKGGGGVMESAELLTDTGYDPSHPDAGCLLLYMKLPAGEPPSSAVWKSLLAGALPASVALMSCGAEGRAVMMFPSVSDTAELVDVISAALESVPGLTYSVSRASERIVITFEIGDGTGG